MSPAFATLQRLARSSNNAAEGIEHYDNLPLALPAVVEEGVTWEEIGVRYPFGVMNTAESEPDYAIEHTVTGCRETALPDVGTRTVCTIESTGGVGTWTVAEGLGPVGLEDALLAEVAWE